MPSMRIVALWTGRKIERRNGYLRILLLERLMDSRSRLRVWFHLNEDGTSAVKHRCGLGVMPDVINMAMRLQALACVSGGKSR